MNYYIADTHFGHYNVLRFDSRPFSSVDEMDKKIIENWNSRVTDDDDIYIVGDLIYRTERSPQWYLDRLKGRKHLVIGNHDGKVIKDKSIKQQFVEVKDIIQIDDGGNRLVLCHYPMAEWPGYFRGAYHIYAHIHNNTTNQAFKIMKDMPNALNAGCMINNYMPVTFKELVTNNELFKSKYNLVMG